MPAPYSVQLNLELPFIQTGYDIGIRSCRNVYFNCLQGCMPDLAAKWKSLHSYCSYFIFKFHYFFINLHHFFFFLIFVSCQWYLQTCTSYLYNSNNGYIFQIQINCFFRTLLSNGSEIKIDAIIVHTTSYSYYFTTCDCVSV